MRNAISSILVLTAMASVTMILPATADEIEFEGLLSGDAMIPPVESGASGTVEAVYETETQDLRWFIFYDGLASPVNLIRLYGPAGEGEIGELISEGTPFDMPSPILGGMVISVRHLDAMLASEIYIVLANDQYPDGAMRAQLTMTGFEAGGGDED